MVTPVQNIMTGSVVKTDADAPVTEAASLLLDRDIGSLVIVDGNDEPRAVVTRTDFVEMASDESLITGSNVPTVERLMEEDVITASAETSVDEAAEMMEDHGIHHLPIVEDGALTGIVTTTDLATHVFRE